MPYNNTPIAPPGEVTGTVSLPLARVKKIINADDDVQNCSNNAAFAIAVATEMFVRDLVSKTHDQAKLQKKPRRNIQYKDVANAVARNDNLEFLTDVVPRTIPYQEHLAKEAERKAEKERREKAKAEKEQRQRQSEASSSTRAGDDAMEVDRPSTASRESRASMAMDVDMLDNAAPNGVNGFANPNGAP